MPSPGAPAYGRITHRIGNGYYAFEAVTLNNAGLYASTSTYGTARESNGNESVPLGVIVTMTSASDGWRFTVGTVKGT